jgi:hypothetical protein
VVTAIVAIPGGRAITTKLVEFTGARVTPLDVMLPLAFWALPLEAKNKAAIAKPNRPIFH